MDIMQLLSLNQRRLNERITQANKFDHNTSIAKRVAAVLDELAEKELLPLLIRQDIADYMGFTREHVSNAMNSVQAESVIVRKPHTRLKDTTIYLPFPDDTSLANPLMHLLQTDPPFEFGEIQRVRDFSAVAESKLIVNQFSPPVVAERVHAILEAGKKPIEDIDVSEQFGFDFKARTRRGYTKDGVLAEEIVYTPISLLDEEAPIKPVRTYRLMAMLPGASLIGIEVREYETPQGPVVLYNRVANGKTNVYIGMYPDHHLLDDYPQLLGK